MNLKPRHIKGRGRADKLIKARYPHLSGSEIKTLFEDGKVKVEGRPLHKKGANVESGLEVMLDDYSAKGVLRPDNSTPLNVRYEDEGLLIVEKEHDMHCLPNSFSETGSLANAVAAYLKYAPDGGGVLNCGSINRIDYATAGLVLFCKTQQSYSYYKGFYKSGLVEKYYLARVNGCSFPAGSFLSFDDRIDDSAIPVRIRAGAKKARIDILVLTKGLLFVRLYQGLRHQIRAQLAHHGMPIAGDKLYGSGTEGRLALCSYMVCLTKEDGAAILSTCEKNILKNMS